MKIISETSKKPRKLTPKGTHQAVCVSVVDLGTGEETWQGETKIQRKINVTWALPKSTVEIDGEQRPLLIGKKYTVSDHEKADLTKHLMSWLSLSQEEVGKYDCSNLIDKTALVTVSHDVRPNGEQYSKVTSVSALPEGLETPTVDMERWEYDPDNPRKNWDKLQEWQRERVAISHEYKAAKANGKTEDETDSIPF